MDISNRIRELRKKQGMNQFELADSIEISVDTVRRWESNKQFPRADELVRLAFTLASTLKCLNARLFSGTHTHILHTLNVSLSHCSTVIILKYAKFQRSSCLKLHDFNRVKLQTLNCSNAQKLHTLNANHTHQFSML